MKLLRKIASEEDDVLQQICLGNDTAFQALAGFILLFATWVSSKEFFITTKTSTSSTDGTRYGVSIQDGWTVVDIGAGIGDFSIYAAYDKPNTTIYAYEPFFDSYELFIKNLQLNNIENVNPFQIAVWSTDGELILDASSGEPLQITSRKIDGTSEQGKRDFVQAISLLSILETHAVEKVDLIKMDCEGAEYEVLMKVLPGTFDKIERIIMEYHNLDSDRNYKRLIPFLEDQGYHVRRYKNAVHDHIGFLYAAKG